MAEMDNYNKRLAFHKGRQKEFILSVKNSLNLTWREMAEISNVSTRTLTDWKNEKFTMSFKVAKILSKKSGIPLIYKEIKDPFWNNKSAAIMGGKANYKKYGKIGGEESYRKDKWKNWWENEGRHSSKVIGKFKTFNKPKLSSNLAEFVGIVLGDGSISDRQVTITLHSIDDNDYGKFLIKLVNKLFNLKMGIYARKDCKAKNYIISRTKLVNFLTHELGLKKGNKVKQRVDIPSWIKNNREYSIACVRGLVDTDGSIFTHSYKSGSKNKIYKYKKLSFTNYSPPILKSVHKIFSDNNISSRICNKRDVRIDSKKDMSEYFRVFNSNNLKHLKRYKS